MLLGNRNGYSKKKKKKKKRQRESPKTELLKETASYWWDISAVLLLQFPLRVGPVYRNGTENLQFTLFYDWEAKFNKSLGKA